MLNGFTAPYTPSGRSSLAPAPPWHYAGQILSIAFKVDESVAQSLLPLDFGGATGMAAAHFCEWQSTTDGSELLDPVYAQYKEFFVLIESERHGAASLYCPFIYVDQDISMARGWMQGWPKKLGSIWMTRSYDIESPAASRVEKRSQFGASLSVKDRRLAEARFELTGGEAKPLGFLALPTYGLVSSPSIIGTVTAGSRTLVRAVVEKKVQGPSYEAEASMTFFDSPRDELSLLQPKTFESASLSTFALSVTGAVPA